MGAKAEGQRGIIEGYGVTEEAMGAPIRASMDTEVIAHSKSGLEIHLDKFANAADFLIPVGRIKAHTDFRGEVESGICKMLVIGMGKQHGAYQCHKLGFTKNQQTSVSINSTMRFESVLRLPDFQNSYAQGVPTTGAYSYGYQNGWGPKIEGPQTHRG